MHAFVNFRSNSSLFQKQQLIVAQFFITFLNFSSVLTSEKEATENIGSVVEPGRDLPAS
jgi:hypothetical protein